MEIIKDYFTQCETRKAELTLFTAHSRNDIPTYIYFVGVCVLMCLDQDIV